jgi:hypothetical protein
MASFDSTSGSGVGTDVDTCSDPEEFKTIWQILDGLAPVDQRAFFIAWCHDILKNDRSHRDDYVRESLRRNNIYAKGLAKYPATMDKHEGKIPSLSEDDIAKLLRIVFKCTHGKSDGLPIECTSDSTVSAVSAVSALDAFEDTFTYRTNYYNHDDHEVNTPTLEKHGDDQYTFALTNYRHHVYKNYDGCWTTLPSSPAKTSEISIKGFKKLVISRVASAWGTLDHIHGLFKHLSSIGDFVEYKKLMTEQHADAFRVTIYADEIVNSHVEIYRRYGGKSKSEPTSEAILECKFDDDISTAMNFCLWFIRRLKK